MKAAALRVAPRRQRTASTDSDERMIEALHLSEPHLTLAIEGSGQGIFDWDVALDQIFLSRRAQELFGLDAAEPVRLRHEWAAMVRLHPDDMGDDSGNGRLNLLSGSPTSDVEFRLMRPDGGVRWLRQRAVVLSDASGKACRVAGSIDDITDSKLDSEALRESEIRFRSLTELSSDWYWRQDETLRFTYLSSQAHDLTGHAGESSYGKLRWELANMSPMSGDWAEHKAVLAARQPFRDLECQRTGNDGSVRYLSMSGAPIFDDDGRFKGYHGIGRNITERKRAEEALRLSEERFALAVEGANEGIFDWDITTDTAYLSRRAQELFGLAPGALWRPRGEWQTLITVQADDTERLRDVIRRHFLGQPSCEAEFRIVLRDGSIRWFRQRGTALHDASGAAYRIVGSFGDITESKLAQAALQRIETQLRHAQRLEAVGTLAGGIAHDFNNILGAILGYGEMALASAAEGSRLRRDLDSILTAGERGRALVEQILTFSRNSVSARVAVDVERVVCEALDQLMVKLPPNVTIMPSLRAGHAAVLGDATQVHQLVMNLTINAFQAMACGGTVRVLLEPLHIDAPLVTTTGTAAAGDYIRLEVADSGTGISPDIIERIFDPFFTTKEVGVGTGLGLSLVHGIVSELGGVIEVKSTPGVGSVFTVHLPRAGDAGEDREDKTPDVAQGNAERVLVVDDEEALLRLMTETLDGFGYLTTGFTSSQVALDAFRSQPQRYAAVITDDRMPGMTGSALLREIRRVRPTIPTLLVTGNVGADVVGRAKEAGADEVLRKPLSMRDLAAGLARVLARVPAR